MAVDGALGEQLRLASIAGVSPVGRSGADLQRDAMLVQAGLALTSGEGGADLQQKVNANIYADTILVSDVSPDWDIEAGGDTITLTGTNLTNVISVLFDGIEGTNLTINSATELEVDAPAHADGTVDIVVVSEDDVHTIVNGFEYRVAVTITNVDPVSGPAAGGTVVTLTGTSFTGATAVTFGGTPGTSLTINSDTELEVTTAAHAAGVVNIVVTAPNGSDTETNGYEYTA